MSTASASVSHSRTPVIVWNMLQLFFVLFSSVVVATYHRNVCKTYTGYSFKNFPKTNCWYNPDADLTVPEIIQIHGYPLEVYKIKTKDGYLLDLFRIPHGRKNMTHISMDKRQPIILQHGMYASSAPFVLVGNKSLGFQLADRGYDVWLGNSRGSTYGKGHIKLSTKDYRYWNFSYHEMGIYDLPSSLDIISKVTGRKDIIFLGHSMGTNLPYVYASLMPEHARQRIKLIVSLAPTVYAGAIKTKTRFWTPYESKIKHFTDLIGYNEMLPFDPNLRELSKSTCLSSGAQAVICQQLMSVIFGFDDEQFLPEYLPLIIGHYPAGSSVKNLMHLAQGVNTNKFRHYDYGPLKNLQYYNSLYPPNYDMSKIKIPHYVMYGTNDFVAPEEGAKLLYKKLLNKVGLYKIQNFNHVDFFFAKDVVPVLQEELFRLIKRFTYPLA